MSRTSPVTETLAEDWSCAADFLDDIEVDAKGMCRWTDVANAQTHIRAALRSVQPRGHAQSSREPVEQECFDMLWQWFTERRGAEDMRANEINGGLSAADFKQMLDEHEAALSDTSTDRHCEFCCVPMSAADCCNSAFESKDCPHMAVSSPDRTSK